MNSNEEMEDKLMLTAVANGDETAFCLLLKKYGNNLYSQAFVYTKSSEIAEDIVQDVFLKIWENRLKLPLIERFDNYLFIMARNRIITVMRKRLAIPIPERMQERLAENGPSAEQQLSLKETEQIIEKGIMMMPPQRQIVFRLSRNDGMTHSEIADKLGISRSTVKGHIVHALNFLRDYVNKYSESIILLLLISLNFFRVA